MPHLFDPDFIATLHRAYGAEALYSMRALLRHEVFRENHRLLEAGDSYAMVCRFPGPHNRMALRGDESAGTVRGFIQAYREWKTDCWLEVPPVLFYRDAEASELQNGEPPQLLDAVRQAGFQWVENRSLFLLDLSRFSVPALDPTLELREFGDEDLESYDDAVRSITGLPPRHLDEDPTITEKFVPARLNGARQYRWIAYHHGKPCGQFSMFSTDNAFAVLTQAQTHPGKRSMGLHAYMIAYRLREARHQGARFALAATQWGDASARNLFRAGFTQAYTFPVFRISFSLDTF